MTTAFKPGDRVRYSKTDVHAEMQGWEAEVLAPTEPSGSGTWVRTLKNPNGHRTAVGNKGLYMTSNLELIPPAAFKVGDKVKVINLNGNRTKPPVGLEGVIERQTLTGYWRVNFGHVSPSTHLFYPNELEFIEEKEEATVEHEHKVGDRVTVKGWEDTPNPMWEGRTGTVYDANDQDAVCVKFDDGKPHTRGGWEAKYLVPAEKPFGFEDIQEGDTIRRTKVYKSGALEVREGTVGKRGDYYWADETGHFILAYDAESETGEGVTYELLERPEPPKEPEIWEDRKPGDKIVTYFKHDGKLERIFTKQEDGEWSTLVMGTSGKLQKGFTRSDKGLAAHLKKYGNEVHLIK